MAVRLPEERTPGTRRRRGMSVGIDCTSHALQEEEAPARVSGGDHTASSRANGRRIERFFISSSLSLWI